MLQRLRCAATTLALLPLLAIAQEKPRPDPLDASQAVPPLSYQSVFERYQAGKDEKETPEKRWVGINRQLMPQPKPAAPAAAGAAPAQDSHRHGQQDRQQDATQDGHQHLHGGQQHAH